MAFDRIGAALSDHARFIRIVGYSGAGLSAVINCFHSQPAITQRSLVIYDTFFAGDVGFLGWFSNALGLYEGITPRHGIIPKYLLEFVRLRGISYLIMDDFHDAFRAPGITVERLVRDINSILVAFPGMCVIVSQALDVYTPEYAHLLDHKVVDVPICAS